MRAYFLTSARLGFGVWSVDYLPLAAQVWGDERVMTLNGGAYAGAALAHRLTHEIAMAAEHGVQYWPLFVRDSGAFAGCCGLKARDAAGGVWEFGVQICHVLWSHGLGREAVAAVLEYGFGPLAARAIRAAHHPQNAASRRLMESFGMRSIAEEFHPRTRLMEPCYEMTRQEYAARRDRAPLPIVS